MLAPRKLAACVLIACALQAKVAADPVQAPPFTHLHSPRLACRNLIEPLPDTTPAAPDCIQLRAGYYYDEPTWALMDIEHKQSQDAVTRLDAENKSLRESASGWQPGWKTLLGAVVTGVALGYYLDRKL